MLCCNDNLTRFGHLSPLGSDYFHTQWELARAVEMACVTTADDGVFTYGWARWTLTEHSDLLVDIYRALHPSNFLTRHGRVTLLAVVDRVTTLDGAALVGIAELERHLEDQVIDFDAVGLLVDVEASMTF